jgi:glucosamine-6-phosphate deaminase
MEIVILPTPAEVGRLAARKIAQVIARKPTAVVGLATGSSPLAIYADLTAQVEAGTLDARRVRGVALDEYVGIPADHPESYLSVITRQVTRPLGLDPANVFVPDGRADDIPAACAAYEATIRELGGVDIQILGIGANGHIGFNEPARALIARTHCARLRTATRRANAALFGSMSAVPHRALSMGMATILYARRIVLVATGAGKARCVARMIEGPVTPMLPASFLQLHRHAEVWLDRAASGELRRGIRN